MLNENASFNFENNHILIGHLADVHVDLWEINENVYL